MSIKVDSRKVEGMPSPRPMFEIYVHSRRLEGIHLRGGKVARGGIRWSDRHDDFRTEVLGLMKTQMVKNSIIVPVGSKGGFVLKGDVPTRPALDDYLVDRYREFVSGLLDVTDNIVDGKVLHPPEVVRHDGDDPYLVVAADKGTAHLSDTANSVSAQYGFWLGDAFASGGSVGYDHKKVGDHRPRGLGVREAPLPQPGRRTSRRSPSRWRASATWRATSSATGCCRAGPRSSWPPSTTSTSSSTPTPTPRRASPSASGSSACRARAGGTTTPKLISKGGGIFDRSAKAIPLVRGDAEAPRPRRRKARPARRSSAAS